MIYSEEQKKKYTLKYQKSGLSVKKVLDRDTWPGKSGRFSTLNSEKQAFSMEKGFESDARQAKSARFSMLNGEKQGFSMEKGSNEMHDLGKDAKNSMLNGEKQGFGMEKEKKPWSITLVLQAEGQTCPLACWLPHAAGRSTVAPAPNTRVLVCTGLCDGAIRSSSVPCSRGL